MESIVAFSPGGGREKSIVAPGDCEPLEGAMVSAGDAGRGGSVWAVRSWAGEVASVAAGCGLRSTGASVSSELPGRVEASGAIVSPAGAGRGSLLDMVSRQACAAREGSRVSASRQRPYAAPDLFPGASDCAVRCQTGSRLAGCRKKGNGFGSEPASFLNARESSLIIGCAARDV